VLEIDLVAPLFVGKGKQAHAIGAVIFHIDPSRFIFPLIQRWPTPSPSAETLLVRRDGDEVVFLNELRHLKNIPLAMRLPLSQQQLPAVMAAMGQEGVVEGVDYRGVPVVSVLNKVAGTSWFMVSKIDKAEIYAPINQLAVWMTALMLALVVAGGGITIFWRQKEKRQYESELEHQAVAKHLDYLAKYANDIILLFDGTGKIIDSNDRALEVYGYTAAELSGLNVAFLQTMEFTPPFAEKLAEIDLAGALRFESMHVRRNGTVFPVEASVRKIDIPGEKLYQSIIRDITERKQAEEQLQLSNALLTTVHETTIDGILVVDANDKMISFNRQFVNMWGVPDEIVESGSNERYLQFVLDKIDDPERFLKKVWHLYVHTQEISNDKISLRDGRTIERYTSPMVGSQGKYYGRVWYFRDITENIQAKDELHQQKTFLHQIIDTDPNLIYVKDAAGKFLMVNQALANFYGMSVQKMIGKTDWAINPVRKGLSGYLEPDTEAFKGRQEAIRAESSLLADGEQHWYLTIKKPLPQAGGSINVLGIAVDITGQKLSEMKLAESYKELQQLTSHLENIKEEERTRIARELHDEMGAMLAALKMRVAWLASKLPSELPVLREETSHISELVSDGVNTVRSIVRQLRPTLLEDVGLDAAIEDYVRQFRQNTHIECILELPEEGLTLEAEQSSAIFRILQESLSNIAKHAQASKVKILFTRHSNSLVMVVEDDGLGFVQTHKEKSFGLLGIRERALIVGGKAKISSMHGKGVQVSVTVPAPHSKHSVQKYADNL
jgi:PAS domain S-box-containing protein